MQVWGLVLGANIVVSLFFAMICNVTKKSGKFDENILKIMAILTKQGRF